MSDYVKKQAAAAAMRVDHEVAQMSPVLITLIFEQVIPILIGCLRRWAEKPSPEQMKAVVSESYAKNPKGVLRKTARRIRGESESPMTKQQSVVLAQAAIDQMIEGEPQEIAQACEAALVE